MNDVQRLQPPELRDTRDAGFSQVVVANGLVIVSGQLAWDRDGSLVGAGDLAAQTHQVMKNLGAALKIARVTYDDIVKLTTYVVDYKPADRAKIRDVRAQYLRAGHLPASTLVGVSALAAEGCLIEIEAIAVLPPTPIPG